MAEPPSIDEELQEWLRGESQRWWYQEAVRIGYQAEPSELSWQRGRLLLNMLSNVGFASFDAFDGFLESAKPWGADALARVQEIAAERGHTSTLEAVDATTILALIGSPQRQGSPALLFPPRVSDAIAVVTDERRGHRPYESPLSHLLRTSFAEPARWSEWLDGAAAKVERARDQVGVLSVEVHSFNRRHPIRLRVEPELQDGVPVPGMLVALTQDVSTPPLEWGVKAGEIVHNARSALDHLVCQLALINRRDTGGSKTGAPRTNFPVGRLESDYERFRHPESGVDPLKEVGPDAIIEIERCLPFHPDYEYHWPNLLLPMNRMWNHDKHLMLRPIWQALGDVASFQMGYAGCDDVIQSATWPAGRALENDTQVAHLRAINPTPDLHVEIQSEIPVQAFLDDLGDDFPEGRAPLIPVLTDIVEYSVYLVGKFDRFFPRTR